MLRGKVIRYRLNKITFHVLPLQVQVPLFIDLIQNTVKNIEKKQPQIITAVKIYVLYNLESCNNGKGIWEYLNNYLH